MALVSAVATREDSGMELERLGPGLVLGLWVTYLSCLPACVQPQAACPAVADWRDARQDEAQIRAALAGWVTAFNAGDYARAAAVWAPDLVGWFPGGPDDTYEREQAAARRGPPASGPRTTFALTIDEVTVSGDLGLVRDTWTQTTEAPTAPPKRSTFRSFEAWRRQPDGSWKIASWIDSLPP